MFYRCFPPFVGHLPVKLPDYNNRLRVLVATYVTFSPDGTELLVNMGGEQVNQRRLLLIAAADDD